MSGESAGADSLASSLREHRGVPAERMLTIGQLAECAGVTIRAVRHYHERGLLPEPARDASGYRRYDAQAVVELIRIKILADGGVPLARIQELLDASPEELAAAVAQIDAALQERVRELEHRRRRIADLAGGERRFLPPELVAYLDELTAAGVRAPTVQIERDAWILLLARYRDRALGWLAQKRADLADPEYQALYRGYDEAVDWDEDDPRVEELADAIVGYFDRSSKDVGTIRWDLDDDPTVAALLDSHFGSSSSRAQERLVELTEAKLTSR
jgi:DNA-binding transcriptional MerR regulator